MMEEFDPIAYINEPRWSYSSLGLERISSLMDKLSNPQSDLRFIHVAGTNGKGSTCAYISSILAEAGHRCGLFTSPYIERFEERIRVDGEDIALEDLRSATEKVKVAAEAVELEMGEHPTEFELMCAVALVHFKACGCDIVVMEVGLGGRLDSTNIIDPDLCVITRIGMDHTDILGDTIDKIAAEKAGIIKQGVPVVSSPQDSAAMDVILSRCEQLGCSLSTFDPDDVIDLGVDLASGVRRFGFCGGEYRTKLLGNYQKMNAATAIVAAHTIADEWALDDDVIRMGIQRADWPARFEVLGRDPLFIVDGAHNPDGALALHRSLCDISVASGKDLRGRISFVMGVLADKDHKAMIEPLMEMASSFITYTPNNPRALTSHGLAESIRAMRDERFCDDMKVLAVESPDQAVALALEEEGPEGIIVAFGTLYSISDIRRALRAQGF